jgi:hypothetical protein
MECTGCDSASIGETVFQPTIERHAGLLFYRNWGELWKILLASKFGSELRQLLHLVSQLLYSFERWKNPSPLL